MGIEQSVSSVTVSSAASASRTSNVSPKTSSESSFKDEMTKVSKSETKSEETKDVTNKKDDAVETKKDPSDKSATVEKDNNTCVNNNEKNKNGEDSLLEANVSLNQYSFTDINNMLANNIQQMVENTAKVEETNSRNWLFSFGSDSKNSLKMSESDANFFLNLTQSNDVSLSNIAAQGQNMLNKGVEVSQVKQHVEVSQTLLNALKEARETNQPLRIDFDTNVSVILRVGREGALSAQFIPGDKVAEQYLRNNIEALKSSFNEKDLPYNELSYSNSSKEQNRKRREEKRQGE